MSAFATPFEAARFRFKLYRAIEDFFLARHYLPVETPLLSPDLIPESSLEIFKTEKFNFSGHRDEMYLIPSPEVWMKKLLSRGSGSLFQISKSFRNNEQSGKIHNNEFSMLEWYSVGSDYQDNIALTAELFASLAPLACEKNRHYFSAPFLVLTMEEAFLKYAGFSLEKSPDRESLRRELISLDLPFDEDDDRETLFNRVFLSLVEPSLPEDRTVVLTDYPSFIPTLAKEKPGTLWSERWEMYIKGIELANCYSEETNQNKIAAYYAAEGTEKSHCRVNHRIDGNYADFFHDNYPKVSGNAMGMDRLIMALSGAESLKETLLFPQNT
ncbi:MAG: elongation factor P--(R)-beta-lysine ligase [Spirochaetales bacterium]|nr:elongation factor P--(R)-beta-lysine ligase [Spirochaetales bacterium]